MSSERILRSTFNKRASEQGKLLVEMPEIAFGWHRQACRREYIATSVLVREFAALVIRYSIRFETLSIRAPTSVDCRRESIQFTSASQIITTLIPGLSKSSATGVSWKTTVGMAQVLGRSININKPQVVICPMVCRRVWCGYFDEAKMIFPPSAKARERKKCCFMGFKEVSDRIVARDVLGEAVPHRARHSVDVSAHRKGRTEQVINSENFPR